MGAAVNDRMRDDVLGVLVLLVISVSGLNMYRRLVFCIKGPSPVLQSLVRIIRVAIVCSEKRITYLEEIEEARAACS